MPKKLSIIKLILCVLSVILIYNTANAQLMGGLFPEDGSKSSGPTVINSNSMDINMENHLITLTGNVVVNNKQTKITADKMVLYLNQDSDKDSKDPKDSSGSIMNAKKAKKIVATGDVIVIKRPEPGNPKNTKEEKATAGKLVYTIKTGEIVLTEKPVLFQGDNYIKGNKITIWRDTDRVVVQGNQSIGQTSQLLIHNNKDGNNDNLGL